MTVRLAPLAKPLLTTKEVCDLLNIGRSALYDVHIHSGWLHPIKVGRKTLFDADEVGDHIDKIKTGRRLVPTRHEALKYPRHPSAPPARARPPRLSNSA